ncbi:hypothetical protein WJX82_008569 [Trebouxia sp. C0006]
MRRRETAKADQRPGRGEQRGQVSEGGIEVDLALLVSCVCCVRGSGGAEGVRDPGGHPAAAGVASQHGREQQSESGVCVPAQVVSPVPEPAASSHISAGGLEPASCLPADLANTTQKDIAVLEHGMIWTALVVLGRLHCGHLCGCLFSGQFLQGAAR